MKYKYVPVFISYDKVADKMNHLAAQGYEYDKEAIVAIRIAINNINLSLIKTLHQR